MVERLGRFSPLRAVREELLLDSDSLSRCSARVSALPGSRPPTPVHAAAAPPVGAALASISEGETGLAATGTWLILNLSTYVTVRAPEAGPYRAGQARDKSWLRSRRGSIAPSAPTVWFLGAVNHPGWRRHWFLLTSDHQIALRRPFAVHSSTCWMGTLRQGAIRRNPRGVAMERRRFF